MAGGKEYSAPHSDYICSRPTPMWSCMRMTAASPFSPCWPWSASVPRPKAAKMKPTQKSSS